MTIQTVLQGRVPVKVWTADIEPSATQQLVAELRQVICVKG